MALMWFKKAAEGCHIISQWWLGVAYEDGGWGVVTNFKTARLWDVATGTCAATLEGHSRPVTSVAFTLKPSLSKIG